MDIEDLNTWETRRQKLIGMLTTNGAIIDLRTTFRELEYPSKRALIEDINGIAKTLKNKGTNLIFQPPSCIACGYVFQFKKNMFKIPSKCPKCKEQRIDWPSIHISK